MLFRSTLTRNDRCNAPKSSPASANIAGGASLTVSDSDSNVEIEVMSISASSFCPSEERTVGSPRATAATGNDQSMASIAASAGVSNFMVRTG